MPLCPEAIIAMQACARIGAIHSVVFAGFSAQALRDRLIDGNAKLLITADVLFRKGNIVNLIEIVSEAVEPNNSNLNNPINLNGIICFERLLDAESRIKISDNYRIEESKQLIKQCIINLKAYHRLEKWQDILQASSNQCKAEALDANDTSFILYTSGSTGKPKGIEHRVAGYILWAKLTMKWVFDIKPTDIYWCTADIGWITGHSYVAYGPLAAGATQFIYEGAPAYPDKDRFWQLIDNYQITIFYTAPTAIRTFIEWGEKYIERYSLKSLRLLGSVGEPINPEVWRWYYNIIGKKRCPIVDTWWQTETGGLMITTIPGAQEMQAGKAGTALPGISAEVNDEGLLLITKPWPAMLKGIYKNPQRYKLGYWSRVEGAYTAGDAAIIDDQGYIQLAGRIDDVINVSGHRLGTTEIESALVTSPKVAEAAVISIPHPIKGECIIAYVTLTSNEVDIEAELKELVSESIGAFARPERIISCPALPKTRSGKIMRRLLKDIAQGKEASGDLSTLENPSLIQELIKLS
jgi:acetyl-CoA synthetase